jgi:integrase
MKRPGQQDVGAGSTGKAMEMLKAVIDGRTYAAVAGECGISRTAVERRVKALAARLCRQVGIEGLGEEGTSFVSRLRKKRNEILVALDNFDPASGNRQRVYRIVSKDELARAALRIRGRSANPSRDMALFFILFATGAWPLEIARLEVRDYLSADGGVKRESELRAEAAVTGRSRPMHFASGRLDESLAEYLRERVDLRQGLGLLSDYRGLDPLGRLFLASTGEGFKITPYGKPGQHRFLCRPILETYRKLFRYAELPGITPLSVRQGYVGGLYGREAGEE